jgi:hypothetical protein
MATLTGSTKDFRPQPLGSTALVIITPFGPAASTSKSLLVSKPIIVTPASDGAFSVDLASYAGTNPPTAYHVRVEWLDSAGNYSAGEDFPWPLVVTGDGALTDMFAIPTATGFLTKGDKGDNGDTVMQAAFDALVARMPKPGAPDRFRVRDKNKKIAFQITPEGNADVAGANLKPSDGFRIRDLAGRIAFEVKEDGKTYIYDPAFGVSGGAAASAAPVKLLHAFLAVGQSNMSGRGLPTSAALDPLDARILQYGATRRKIEPATVPLDMHDAASGLSPATTFAREYLAMQPPNVGVLLIPAAHGGIGFTTAADALTWTPNAASAPQYDLPALAVAQALEAIAAATAAGYTVVLRGILWHQGEANGTMSQTSYATNLDTLIAYLRQQLSAPTLPFVAGQMCPEGMDVTPSKYNVDKAHQATPARVAYAGFAPATRDGHNVGDTTHFSRVGIEYLGKTYLSGYWQAVGNVLAAPPSAPVSVTATKTGTAVTVSWKAPPAKLTAAQEFDLNGTGLNTIWTAPASHIDAYKVETKTGTGAWTTATRDAPMNLNETVTVPAGTTQVRVTALNGGTASAPVTTTAIGA